MAAPPERFVNFDTGTPTALKDTAGSAASSSVLGLVKGDGSTVSISASGVISVVNKTIDLQILISGGGGTITSGNKGWLHIVFGFTITNWLILADQSGSIVVDILRANGGTFPSASIVGAGNMPTLSTQQFAQAAPASWTSTALVTGDYIAFNVTGSPSSVTQITVTLTGTRTT